MLPSSAVSSPTSSKTIPLHSKRDTSTSTLGWPVRCYSSLYPRRLSQCLTHTRYQTNAFGEVSKNSFALTTALRASQHEGAASCMSDASIFYIWDQSCPQ